MVFILLTFKAYLAVYSLHLCLNGAFNRLTVRLLTMNLFSLSGADFPFQGEKTLHVH